MQEWRISAQATPDRISACNGKRAMAIEFKASIPLAISAMCHVGSGHAHDVVAVALARPPTVKVQYRLASHARNECGTVEFIASPTIVATYALNR